MGSFAALLFLLGLAARSRFGDIKLGNVEPDFPTFSWSAMLFCGGIGTSILYWGTIEWTHYFQSPPFDVEPGTAEALSGQQAIRFSTGAQLVGRYIASLGSR